MPRRILQGTVESAKCDKTISVRVERRFRDPRYQKIVKRSSKYAAHVKVRLSVLKHWLAG